MFLIQYILIRSPLLQLPTGPISWSFSFSLSLSKTNRKTKKQTKNIINSLCIADIS